MGLSARGGWLTMHLCPECKAELVERMNRATSISFLGCSNYPECTFTTPLPVDIVMRRMGATQLPGFE